VLIFENNKNPLIPIVITVPGQSACSVCTPQPSLILLVASMQYRNNISSTLQNATG
jgi:hypothetical protein